ncbi:hypothetical protein BDF20DRAFT_826744 [Mycotypha africana]|uniref:uncharacterized protein n=1 Tax=Mycotypha africana TaxID=64632 RepID=UPI0022FFCC54|nr:uncharacterized protein BDF20DRAFT_826744 [Mycotypha africana]KAI8969223.1 hypothetical protein BDF20DRAFT_826744 [Mycotypha africana]
MILVEGLPVGGIFAFFWNLMISASFQFVGFMLTYLLHTSHASKQGSRAGLGVSLVQMGFYIRSRGTLEDDQSSSSTSGTVDDSTDAAIIAYFLMMLGWFLVLRSIADYLRAKQLEKIISSESSTARSALAVTDTSAATSSTNSTTRMNQNTPENMV